jgi:hypothetical protein
MQKIKNIIKKCIQVFFAQSPLSEIALGIYVSNLHGSKRFQDEKRLLKYEYTVFSQYGEDGIINEIFKRIGTTNKYFVEFGGNDGTYNNSTNLLLNGWTGLWIEADLKMTKAAENTFKKYVDSGRLKIKNGFVTVDNIESIFKEHSVPADFDFLSIDIDGNDYYLWKAVKLFKPRVLIIEYNASLGPDNAFVVPYNKKSVWDGKTNAYGASLKALEKLAMEKEYSLAACSSTGTNAFFVRNDLVKDKFCPPFTSENHFEPPRYFLALKKNGHARKIADYIKV